MSMCAPQYVLFGSVSSDGSGVLLFLDDFDSGVFFHGQYLIYKTNICSQFDAQTSLLNTCICFNYHFTWHGENFCIFVARKTDMQLLTIAVLEWEHTRTIFIPLFRILTRCCDSSIYLQMNYKMCVKNIWLFDIELNVSKLD